MNDFEPAAPIEDSGPEATAEQSDFAVTLLTTLRLGDSAIPDDVARRLDAVLAQERSARTALGVGVGVAVGVAVGAGVGAGDFTGTGTGTGTVLPLHGRRRISIRGLTALAGVAAAVILVGGVLGLNHGSLISTNDAGTVAAVASGQAMSVPSSSGTAYTLIGIDQQVRTLLDSRGKDAVTPAAPAPDQAAPAETSQVPPSPVSAPVITGGSDSLSSTAAPLVQAHDDNLTGCLTQLTGAGGITPLAVDLATFDGTPALIVVVPTTGDSSTADVWVVRPQCSATKADVLSFRRIALSAP